ncbi:MAG: hypothetical protein LIP01_08690 [Tannerellaceae bacterium]|nr:hypothetical protein [Tannerellaceae bacterium]
MKVTLNINGKDALKTWGVSLESGALTVLLTPAPMKSFVENKSPLLHGKEIYPVEPRVDERDIQLSIILSAPDQSTFLKYYSEFLEELQKGIIEMQVICGGMNTTYYFTYVSCQTFNQMNLRLAKYVLRLNEPNPTNRIKG